MKSMKEIFSEDSYPSKVVVENGSKFLIPEDIELIESELNKVEIEFACVDMREGPQNVSLEGLWIFINENLTSLIITDLFMPALFETLKFVIKKIRKVLEKSQFKAVTPKKIYTPSLILRFKTEKGELKAPIPSNLTDAQFDKYMDLLEKSFKDISSDTVCKKEQIVDCDIESGKINILTTLEYYQKKHDEQNERNKKYESKNK